MTGGGENDTLRPCHEGSVSSGGYAYHVLDRAVGHGRIFGKPRDFEAFEEVFVEAKKRLPIRLLAWCVLPNHWHLVLWPRGDGDLSEFMRWLTVTHTQRWRRHITRRVRAPCTKAVSSRSPIQEDRHLLAVLRYVERNRCVQIWWGPPRSGGGRAFGIGSAATGGGVLDNEPVALPRDWRRQMQSPEREAELAALRRSVVRGSPFGEESWQERTAKRLGLKSTLRPRGRP